MYLLDSTIPHSNQEHEMWTTARINFYYFGKGCESNHFGLSDYFSVVLSEVPKLFAALITEGTKETSSSLLRCPSYCFLISMD